MGSDSIDANIIWSLTPLERSASIESDPIDATFRRSGCSYKTP